MARVVLDNISKSFRSAQDGASVLAVQELSLEVADGELLVLVGPSGCGKTTTLRLIAGLEDPTAGTLRIGDRAVNSLAPAERDVALVFQNLTLFPHLNVREHLALGLELRRLSAGEIQRRVEETLEMLGLASCRHALPEELSGGQRQRVAFGRALIRRPSVLLLDEPFSHLDAPLRAQLRRELAGLHRELRTTMIFVTHDQAEAMILGQRMGVMDQGRLRQLSGPLEVYRQPQSRFVAGFIGSPPMNFLAGRLERNGDQARFVADAPEGAPSPLEFPCAAPTEALDRVFAGLRPEHFLSHPGPQTVAVEARADFVEALGGETCVHLSTAGHRFIARLAGTTTPATGSTLLLHVQVDRCVLFHPTTGLALTTSNLPNSAIHRP